MKHPLKQIHDVTLRCMNISPAEWEARGHSRDGRIVRARQILSLIAFNEGYSHNNIAAFLKQHRTSILHHISTIRSESKIYPRLQDLIDRVIETLGPIPFRQTTMIMHGWLARSRNGMLTFSIKKPEPLGGYWMAEGTRPFPQDQFQQITYEAGPVRTKIKIMLEDEN